MDYGCLYKNGSKARGCQLLEMDKNETTLMHHACTSQGRNIPEVCRFKTVAYASRDWVFNLRGKYYNLLKNTPKIY